MKLRAADRAFSWQVVSSVNWWAVFFCFLVVAFFLSLCILSGLTMSDLQQVFKGPQSILRNEQSHRTLITTKRKGGKKVILAGRWIAECLLLTYLNVLMKMRCNKFLVIKNASFSSAIQILACRQTAQSTVKLITRKQMLDENGLWRKCRKHGRPRDGNPLKNRAHFCSIFVCIVTLHAQ